MKPKPTPTPRQTSDRVSKIAGRVLQDIKDRGAKATTFGAGWFISVRELKSLAASCLAQDQTKGPRSPKKRKAKGRK